MRRRRRRRRRMRIRTRSRRMMSRTGKRRRRMTMRTIREGSQKNGNFMVFDHNRGGGVSPNHTLIAKLHCFLKHYIHLQLYSICSCT